MLIVLMFLGAVFGIVAGAIAWAAFGVSLLGAFAIYFGSSLLGMMLGAALNYMQAVQREGRMMAAQAGMSTAG